MKRGLNFLFVILLFLSINFISASLNVALSDQGSNVKTKSTGELLSAGNLIYSETFTNAILNGTWNIMIGEGSSLPLEFGKTHG